MHDSRSRLKDEVDRIVVRTAGALPTRLQRLLGGSARSVDGLTLHPEVQLALRLMALDRRPSFETLPVPEARDELVRESRLFAGSSIALPVARDQVIPTAEGDIAGRLYQPEPAHHSGGLLVYFHGGGWVLGDLETHDNTCRFLAKHAKTVFLLYDSDAPGQKASFRAADVLLVITDDRELAGRIRRRGARVAGADWLIGRLERTRLSAPSVGAARAPASSRCARSRAHC